MLYYVLWVLARLFNNGRLSRNCIASMWLSARFDDAIPRNDGVYIAGIIFNTRGVVVPVRVYCCGYQRGCSTKVDCHRIAYTLLAYYYGFWMQFFAMTAFILRVLFLIPAGLYVVVWLCGVGWCGCILCICNLSGGR